MTNRNKVHDSDESLLDEIATRLWRAKDTAEIGPDAVKFDGIVYEPIVTTHTDDEFGSATARITQGDHVHVTRQVDSSLSRALDGVVSWRLLQLLEGPGVRLPESIEVETGPETVKAPGWRGLLGTKVTTGPKRTTITDPIEIARHQIAKLIIGRIDGEELKPPFGRIDLEIERGVTLLADPVAPTLTMATGGSTKIHRMRRKDVLAAIAENQQADPEWVESRRRFEAEGTGDEQI